MYDYKITLGWHWEVTMTSNHLNNIRIRFPWPKIPHKKWYPSRHNYVESTSWPDVVSTLIFGSIWKLNQRLVFHVDSTSFFPLWFHVFSTLNPRVFNVESTWCFPRWINVRTPRGFHVNIWFYMKVDSMSSFQRWIYVMFSTLNPHNIFN